MGIPAWHAAALMARGLSVACPWERRTSRVASTRVSRWAGTHHGLPRARVAAVVTVDGNGVCQKASVGLNGITGKPVAAVGIEQALVGKRLDDQTIQEAAAKAADGLEPTGDIFASADFRAHLARVYAKRALAKASRRV